MAAPHVSPHPPPPASRGARRQAPRGRGSCPTDRPPVRPSVRPPPPWSQPGPARPGEASVGRVSGHPATCQRSERPWQRSLLARGDLARLSSRRGRGGRELGEEGGKEGGRRRRSRCRCLLVSGKSWIYLDPRGSSLCFLSSQTPARERGAPRRVAGIRALRCPRRHSPGWGGHQCPPEELSTTSTATGTWGLPAPEEGGGLWGASAALGRDYLFFPPR